MGQRCGGAYLGSHISERRTGGFQKGASPRLRIHSQLAGCGEPRNASKRRGAVILAHRGPVVAIWIGFPVRASVCRYASSKNNLQKRSGLPRRAHCSQAVGDLSLFLLSAAAAIAERARAPVITATSRLQHTEARSDALPRGTRDGQRPAAALLRLDGARLRAVPRRRADNIGASHVEIARSGVHFDGDTRVGRGARPRADGHEGAGSAGLAERRRDGRGPLQLGRDVPWPELMDVEGTLRVDATLTGGVSGAGPLRFSSDPEERGRRFVSGRESPGRRPSVAKDDCDVPLHLFLDRDGATLYRSLSSESLHKRGYRSRTSIERLYDRQSRPRCCMGPAGPSAACEAKHYVIRCAARARF